MNHEVGTRRTCYINFASHLLNAYNPNMLYPELQFRWSDNDWLRFLDMIADFGYNNFKFWIVPWLFRRSVFQTEAGKAFVHQMNTVCEAAHDRGLQADALIALATVGPEWYTYCPNEPDRWAEVQKIWDEWTKALPLVDIVSIFPGDPGACSRNGCTAETFIDSACEVAAIAKNNIPQCEIEMHTWGPPFFGWGIIQEPEGSQGEFVRARQGGAWRFDKARADRSMAHLIKRLPDFPKPVSVAINLGFNPNAEPDTEEDARGWVKEVSQHCPIQSWDFSLIEGENAVLPHWRFERAFVKRRLEYETAPYRGGTNFTMTPALNQLSLYEGAVSFSDFDADPKALARTFYNRLFGSQGEEIVPHLPVFEEVPDWGNYSQRGLAREEISTHMQELSEKLEDLAGCEQDVPFFPDPDEYRKELLWFSRFYADATAADPDVDELISRYWEKVYGIYNHVGNHVDFRAGPATRNLVDALTGASRKQGPMPGEWA